MKRLRTGFLPLVVALGLSRALGAQPVIRTIAGRPLTIQIADDTSMQVGDSRFELTPSAVFYPECLPGPTSTGDSGILVRVAGVLYGPSFPLHPCGTGLGGLAVTPWTAVSIGGVTGVGTSADPFEVVVVADAAASGLRLTETVQYVNGTGQLRPILRFTNVGPSSLFWDTFLGVNVAFLAFPILDLGRPGEHAALKTGAPFPSCFRLNYRVLLPEADRYSMGDGTNSWGEIQSGDLTNTTYAGCPSSGAATEWVGRSLPPGQSLVLAPNSGITFLADGAAASVPATSPMGTAILVAGIALAGSLALARRVAA